MPRAPVDPSRLRGEALNRWYQRTPDEIEAERSEVERRKREEFFRQGAAERPLQRTLEAPKSEDDVLWVANSRGGYSAVRPSQSDFLATIDPEAANHGSPPLPSAIEQGQLMQIGNPHNPRLRREWEAANGKPWPRTPTGENYDVAHTKAIADGGTNTLDNIRPMDPDAHRASHKEDQSRWGKRAGIARAFGGKVEPPANAARPRGTTVRGFGPLGIISGLTGILSGRTRTDTPVHFWNDMLGYSSEDDLPREDLIV